MPRSKSFDPNQHLAKALSALDAQITALQAKRAQLAAIIGGGKVAAVKTASAAKSTRAMSPEAKAKISEAQKKRWADAKNAAKKKK